MSPDDRERRKEERAARLKKAFAATLIDRHVSNARKPHILDKKALAGVALTMSAFLIFATSSNIRSAIFNVGRATIPPTYVDVSPGHPFPSHGTVKRHVPNDYLTQHETLELQGRSDGYLAVVRIRSESGVPIATAYLASRDVVKVPMPPGAYRVSVAYGSVWIDDARLFGIQTAVLDVADVIFVKAGVGQRLDLEPHARGNLPMSDSGRSSF